MISNCLSLLRDSRHHNATHAGRALTHSVSSAVAVFSRCLLLEQQPHNPLSQSGAVVTFLLHSLAAMVPIPHPFELTTESVGAFPQERLSWAPQCHAPV